MFFGISAQNDAEWWSKCIDLIDFRISSVNLKLAGGGEGLMILVSIDFRRPGEGV